MSNVTTTSLPRGKAAKLAVLLEVMDGMSLTEGDGHFLDVAGRFRPAAAESVDH